MGKRLRIRAQTPPLPVQHGPQWVDSPAASICAPMRQFPACCLRGGHVLDTLGIHAFSRFAFVLFKNHCSSTMRHCNTCRSYSPAQAEFCVTCGSSFGSRLCPKGHKNPISASYCSTCGSSKLSRPHAHRTPDAFTKLLLGSLVLAAVVLIGILVAAMSTSFNRIYLGLLSFF